MFEEHRDALGYDNTKAFKAYQQSHLVASRVSGMNISEHWGTPENKVIYETKKRLKNKNGLVIPH